ncbi:MAG TPA: Fe-S cluster assembly protein SufD [Longimicrobiales bacterium]|nr:Fe-S cluster assembly protein SufD [Longimicrobiales bacterium]
MTATAVGTGYGKEVLARFALEPDWLREQRAAAFAAFERLPLPTTKLEEWRYTDPAKLKWDRVGVAPADVAADETAARAVLAGKESGGHVIVAGLRVVEIALSEELRAKGVLLMELAQAAREYGELVMSHLGKALPEDAGKFAAQNAAFWSAGIFLYVPRGVRIETPIRVVRWIDQAGFAYFPRTLMVAGEASQVGLVEEFVSPDLASATFSSGAVEVFAAASAQVRYVAMQRWGRNVHHLSTQRTVAQRDANCDSLVVNLGATVARVELHAALRGPGARSDMLGLYFAQHDQHFDHSTRQDHEVPHATSDLLYKGALDDRSRAIFRGLIKVFPKAQRTDAYQTNRNLILSRNAEATSLPNLEIEADDVRCSHAATVGQLDREELFYIMSRGVARREAERLVVFGFFGEVLERLPMPEVVRELRGAIEEKIAG